MAPEDDATSDLTSSGRHELAAQVASLTHRVEQLEQALSLLGFGDLSDTEAAPDSRGPRQRERARTPPPPRLPVAAKSTEVAAAESSAYQIDRPSVPSLEDRLGSQVFNRIGIVAILIGATWFLKLAMDNHWIGPLGRILIGLAAGTGLILWSERFRRREFAAFSYSLKAVGSGVLYLSLWASFQLYHLLPSQAAFGLMLLVTLWNAWMAWVQKSELLAAYAIAGGFATPLLLSTGGNHQVFLFSYLLTIDIATIALVRLQSARSHAGSWARLMLAALPATILFYIGWYSSFYTRDQLAATSLFIALFFLAFLTVPFRFGDTVGVATGSELQPAEAIADVLVPLTNAVFGSLAFYAALEDSGNHAALPWVALLFAAIYLGLMRVPWLAARQSVAARAVHLSLAVVFLTIAIPLKASGRWITIGWLAEGVALLWVSARLDQIQGASSRGQGSSVQRMMRLLAALALSLGFFGLLVLPFWMDRAVRTAFFNQRFATEFAGVPALAAAAWISNRAMGTATLDDSNSAVGAKPTQVFPSWFQVTAVSVVALNLIALQAGIREIQTFWAVGPANGESALQAALSISAFLMLYGAVLLAIGFWKHSALLRWQALILLIIAILKTFLYDVRSLSQGYRVASFLGLGALLMAVSFAYVKRTAKPAVD